MNINDVKANYIIDAASAQKVSDQLFSALQKKSIDYSKKNLSGFNRPTIGVEFYTQKTDISFQRQIAMQNSGAFQRINLNSVQALNSFAAQQLYGATVNENVGGKMTIDSLDYDFDFIQETVDTQDSINIFQTNKDKKGSNPFSFEQYQGTDSKDE